ncbi:hypothetical protein WG947_12410 [Pontibacter sp. H259]|uniref:hypothetical protein n=1 Tax=Pontibacter sp. H259 TaxID=3133421 RepID=UPI0030BBF2A8
MQKLIAVVSIAATIGWAACQSETKPQGAGRGLIDSKTGAVVPTPADVLAVTKPLISGELFSNPDFSSTKLVYFDTAQHIQLLDTTGALFMKARITRNSETFTGYISKAIIPEQ